MGTVFVCHRIAAAHHFDISSKQSDLSLHDKILSSVRFDHWYVLVLEWSINSDCFSWHWYDVLLFCFSMDEAGWCHNNLLALNPIDVIFNCESSISDVDSCCDGSPGLDPWSSIHVELAVEATNTFVSKHRLLCSVIVSIQDKGKLMSVGMLCCSCNKSTSIHGYESCLNNQVCSIGEY